LIFVFFRQSIFGVEKKKRLIANKSHDSSQAMEEYLGEIKKNLKKKLM